MANRILRDWTQSETLNDLSEGAEVFFTRLIMKADDFGCYYGNPKLLKAALFPLKDYNFNKILVFRDECQYAKLIYVYVIDGKEYVQIVNFGQRLRQMNSKFPQPDSNPPTFDSNPPPETKRNEVETETETEVETNVWPTFDDFWYKYDKKVDRPKCELKWKKIKQADRENILSHLESYIPSTPEKEYRKNPLTYLNSQSWENEITVKTYGKSNSESRTNSLIESFAKRVDAVNKGEKL
jgi:hypothetical protein